MRDELEDNLRRALRRVDPPADLAERVMRQIKARPARIRGPRLTRLGAWGAAAACLLLGSSLVFARVAQQHRLRGEEAKHEVMWALRITGEELRHARVRTHKLKRENP